jgi:hypothetical protein
MPRAWWWIAATFLFVLGATLAHVHAFGTSMPLLDMWNGEGDMYLRFHAGTLTLADIAAPHNEHRIFFSRAVSFLLLLANGQWDNRLACVASALLHSVCAALSAWVFWRAAAKRSIGAICLLTILVFAPPYSRNDLSGFQSQFGFAYLLGLLTVWWLGIATPFSRRWWLGLACALASIFTVGAGYFAAAAVAGVAVLRLFRTPARLRDEIPTVIAAAAVVVFGALLTVHVAPHAILRAHSPIDFAIALGKGLSFPFTEWPWLAPLVWAPLGAFSFAWLARRAPAEREAEVSLIVGLWVACQCLAIAYSRGAGGQGPAARHFDVLLPGTLAQATVALGFLAQGLRAWTLRNVSLGIWATGVAAGLSVHAGYTLVLASPRDKAGDEQSATTLRVFLATGDRSSLVGRPIPYPEAMVDTFARYAGDPYLRTILPPSVRRPLDVEPEILGDGEFTRDGSPPELGPEAWGSWHRDNRPATGDLTSKLLPAPTTRYLRFEIAGMGAKDLDLAVVPSGGGEMRVFGPIEASGARPTTWTVRSPKSPFRIVARDRNADPAAWLAFRGPVETPSLSVAAETVCAAWPLFAGLGAAWLFAAGVFGLRERRAVAGTRSR